MSQPLQFPRPEYGDYLCANLIVTPAGRVYSGTVATYLTVETLDVPGGLVANTVYEVAFQGDTEVLPTAPISVRMGALYGNGSLANAAVLFESTWSYSTPVPVIVAPFVCPLNYSNVQFVVQILGSGTFRYGSGPGGLIFGVKAIGTLQSVNVIST